jgi:hypothetical protein
MNNTLDAISMRREEPSVKERRIIFITGASRSGTTLLSCILGNHPAVHPLKEMQYFGQWWDPGENARRFTRVEGISAAAAMYASQEPRALLGKVHSEHRMRAASLIDGLGPAGADPAALFSAVAHDLTREHDKGVPCEKTPRNIFYASRLLDVYPSAHIVHMVRDPRAVMASQKKRWQRRRLSAKGFAMPRYESLRVWINYHPYTAARLWASATSAALQVANRQRVTLTRFEDLLRQPEETVRSLCSRLGLDYDPTMLDVAQTNSSHQTSAGGARRGLYVDAIDRWRGTLTGAEISIATRKCGRLMPGLGYEMDTNQSISRKVEQIRYGLTYPLHLGGVLLINPRRALVQWAMLNVSGNKSVDHSAGCVGRDESSRVRA